MAPEVIQQQDGYGRKASPGPFVSVVVNASWRASFWLESPANFFWGEIENKVEISGQKQPGEAALLMLV